MSAIGQSIFSCYYLPFETLFVNWHLNSYVWQLKVRPLFGGFAIGY